MNAPFARATTRVLLLARVAARVLVPASALARTLVVALLGATLAILIKLPLPWFTGPLIIVAVCNVSGVRLASLPYGREGGQWIIGFALGLYFTPEIVRFIIRLAPWVGVAVLFAVVLGLAGAWVLKWLSGESATTCFFAAAIGGAAEMATQAERHGGRVDRVAAAHSLRIMLVALVVPFVLQWWGVQGSDPYAPAASLFDPAGFAVLVAATGGGAIVLTRLNIPNAFMLGPLLTSAAITAAGFAWSSLPTPVLDAGQLLIGVALGARFAPEFFRAAPRYLAAVVVLTLGYLAASAIFGAWLAQAAGLATATSVLATTPGGIGEMAITAKVLKLGAPIVTAFHSIRMALVVLIIGGLFRGVTWLRRRRQA
jgi:membrane AbrB-like protein